MLGLFQLLSSPDVNCWTGVLWCFYQTLILTAPIHCRASIDSHSDGTHSLQSIHWLSFWRHPFTAEHPLTLILTAPIHCRASIDSHSDGTHSLQCIHWLSFWRHPFTAEHPLTLILTAPIHCRASIDSHSDGTHSLQCIHCWDTFLQTWGRIKFTFILNIKEILIFRWTVPLMRFHGCFTGQRSQGL